MSGRTQQESTDDCGSQGSPGTLHMGFGPAAIVVEFDVRGGTAAPVPQASCQLVVRKCSYGLRVRSELTRTDHRIF